MTIPRDRPYLIGETAFHHQGAVADLHLIVDAVASSGCHAVKFHLLADLDDYMVRDHPAYDTVRPWLLGADAWDDVMRHARAQGLELVLLCNDVEAVRMVGAHQWGPAACEVHATGINDLPLLHAVAQVPGTTVLGVGGCTLHEVQLAVETLRRHGKDDILLMHGFQNYPTDPAEVRLSRMALLRDLFGLPVGYADHTDPAHPDHAALAASVAASGVNVLEKHITPWPGEQRIDHQAAVSVDVMRQVARLHDLLWRMHGNDPLATSAAERKYGALGTMKKAIVARRDLPEGTVLTHPDLAYKRTGTLVHGAQADLPRYIGARTTRAFKQDEPIDPAGLDAMQEADLSSFFVNKATK
jgi:sialic acid synthase SpsE